MKKLKFINNCLGMFLCLFSILCNAQAVSDTLKNNTPKNQKRIDGVVAVVGDLLVLDSDIDKSFIELQSQGVSIKNITRCEMMGKLLEDKLYAHQAIQDSIPLPDTEINGMMENQLNYMVEQLGDMSKVVQYFKKSSEADLRSDLYDIIKINKLSSKMQEKIVSSVEITPEEVRSFYKSIPKDDLPTFGAEVELAQIVIKPKIPESEKERVIKRLKEIKADVLENGASFFSKAVLYSQDPGSRSNGGFYKMNKKTPFVKEFKDVAFSLNEGEISEPFETDFGYHIIYLEKVRGQELDLRHILLIPNISSDVLKEAKQEIDLIRKRILEKEITFSEAAKSFSHEKETKNNGGTLINPKSFDTRFELTKMDPSLYNIVSGLKTGEVSLPMIDEDRSGRKSYKIITLTNSTPEHVADYAKDYTKIRELALKEKQIKAIAKWSSTKINDTFIKINGEYQNCVFTNNWLKK